MVFGIISLIRLTNHWGICFGSVVTRLKSCVNLVWVSWKALNQKLGILSFPGDFHVLDFFRASLRSSWVTSFHSCSLRASYFLLSFSIHGAGEFCYQTIFFPENSVSLPQMVVYLFWYNCYYYYFYYYHYLKNVFFMTAVVLDSWLFFISMLLYFFLPHPHLSPLLNSNFYSFTFLRILAVPSKTDFCKVPTFYVIPNFSK